MYIQNRTNSPYDIFDREGKKVRIPARGGVEADLLPHQAEAISRLGYFQVLDQAPEPIKEEPEAIPVEETQDEPESDDEAETEEGEPESEEDEDQAPEPVKEGAPKKRRRRR